MPTGKVVWYNVQKGYGQIHQDGGGNLVVRHLGIVDGINLEPGQAVEFEREGLIAYEVVVILPTESEARPPLSALALMLRSSLVHQLPSTGNPAVPPEIIEEKKAARYGNHPDQELLDEVLGSKQKKKGRHRT